MNTKTEKLIKRLVSEKHSAEYIQAAAWSTRDNDTSMADIENAIRESAAIPQNDEQENDEPESVDLIASGYEWECPNCETLNHEIEVTERVTCACGLTFPVNNYEHALA